MNPDEQPRSLAQLRRHRGVTQGAMEKRVGMSQAAVLSAERARDPRLSTVTRFIEALGGRLQLVASFDDGDYPIAFREPSVPAAVHRPAWRIRAWDDPWLAERFLAEGIVAVSEDDLGQAVTDFASDQALRRIIQDHPDNRGRSENAIGTFVTYWRHFSHNMKVGDIIVLAYRERRGKLKAAIGTVTGEYEYRSQHDLDKRLRHRRTIRWHLTLDRSDLPEDLRRTVNAPGTIGRFGAADAGDRLSLLGYIAVHS
ncbi:helix-turn-helix domain-containing protein [Nocardia sp. NPDC058499]|uniref:helix-turn-helix domain-containing protein n=1 Tax=Nocardia sp. NPDC058499 TaxID=3346530 RepID=UPI0036638BF5